MPEDKGQVPGLVFGHNVWRTRCINANIGNFGEQIE